MTKSNAATKPQTPLYRQIKEYIVENIDKNTWKTGQKVSSEAELGNLFKTSRMTVNRALRELAAEGRVVRKQGDGTYVASLKPQSALLEITSIAEEIKKSGAKYSAQVHLLCEEKATPELAAGMQLQPYSTLLHSVLTHKKNGVPVQLSDRYINPAIAPNYLKQDFTRITPSEYLLKIAPVSKIEHIVEALIPPAWIRELLMINSSEPCLALFRRTWSGEVIATKSCFYYPGSRHRLGGTFTTSNNGSIQVG